MARIMHLGFDDLPRIYNIDFPVGPNMPNARDDVLLIQTLMKMSLFTRFHPGGWPVEASKDVVADGWYGKQTKRMTEAYEKHIQELHKLIIADGVFEPSSNEGYTGRGILFKIIHLNRSAKEHGFGEYDLIPTNPEVHPILRGSLNRRPQNRPSRQLSL